MAPISRGLAVSVFVASMNFMSMPTDTNAQDKKTDVKATPKDFRGKVKLDDIRDKTVSFPTCDSLALQGYWFPAQKNLSDCVLMFPAPGKTINDDWIALAKVLSEQNFSVLLFDWRGCGMNCAASRGIRLFDNPKEFMLDPFTKMHLGTSADGITKKGMDYNQLPARYRDSIMYDLAGARFFLDKQNDDRVCNSNRIWIVSEGQGADVGFGFVASEAYRPSIYNVNPMVKAAPRIAALDYAGLVALSREESVLGTTFVNTALNNKGNSAAGKDARLHLEKGMAMLMLYGKQEGAKASNILVEKIATGNEESLKQRFKYLREIDISKLDKPATGAGLLNAEDTLGTRDTIIKAMIEISIDKQNAGKVRTIRNVGQIVQPPRLSITTFKPN